ncbi:YHYH protein [Candidatus Gracilibacteria bacterium]|nr:YHYH protein [Candidatus Gracilibacteria bacterium]
MIQKYIILATLSVFLVSCGFEKTETESSDTGVNTATETSEGEQAALDDFKNDLDTLLGVDEGSESETETDSVELTGTSITQEFIEKNYAESLVGDVEIVDCTLSSGTESQCYKFTVAPDPTIDHEIGPWCPRNITDTEIAGGIWPDDGQIYEVSGEFVQNLAVFYEDDAWQLYDTETGEINVTDTQVSCEGAAKPDVEEEYQNHCVECQLSYMDEIPNVTYTIPMSPEPAESTQSINNGIGVGVAFNGVKFDASAPTQNILAANTIAPFDDCGGHINLNVGYHYHETTGCSKEISIIDEEESMIGLALDGYPMFTQAADTIDLDSCGGHIVDGVYHYHVAETGSNQFLGCYAAEYGCVSTDADATCDASQTETRGGPPQGGDRPEGPPPAR